MVRFVVVALPVEDFAIVDRMSVCHRVDESRVTTQPLDATTATAICAALNAAHDAGRLPSTKRFQAASP